jgi:hypothetical protein
MTNHPDDRYRYDAPDDATAAEQPQDDGFNPFGSGPDPIGPRGIQANEESQLGFTF